MVVDYSDWVSRKVRVANVLLDPLNPRIPGASEDLAQPEILAELIKNDDVHGLAKDITAKGYFPTESLVVIPKDEDLYTVVEGNRRLAALKVVLSPEAAPHDKQELFRKLSSQTDRRQLSWVPVIIAPSREDAYPLILERHTHSQLQRWKPPMQARFFRILRERGLGVDDIAAMAGVSPGMVKESLRTDVLYQLACSLDLQPHVLAKIRNPRSFPLSTLERALESEDIQDFLGVKRDPAKVFTVNIPPAEFLKGFGRLVSDIAKGTATSRTKLHDRNTIKEYLDEFGEDKPRLKKAKPTAIEELISETPPPAPAPKEPPKPRPPRKSKSIIPPGFRCYVEADRIRETFDELRSLKLEKYPNASALLLRTLLDLAVTHYLEETNQMKAVLKKYQAKGRRGADWAPSLRQQLTFLLDNPPPNLHGQPLAALKRFSTDKSERLCLDALDKFVHNKYTPPSESELRAVWTTIEPLMKLLFEKPFTTVPGTP